MLWLVAFMRIWITEQVMHNALKFAITGHLSFKPFKALNLSCSHCRQLSFKAGIFGQGVSSSVFSPGLILDLEIESEHLHYPFMLIIANSPLIC